MKYIAHTLFIATAIAAAGSTNAFMIDDFNPVIGVDYYQAWMKPKTHYDRIFPKTYPGASVYVGVRVLDIFAFELGYDWSKDVAKDWTLSRGETFFNRTIDRTVSGKTELRRAGGHLDLMGILPIICDCFELFATVGYGWVQPRIEIENISIRPGTTLHSAAIVSLSGGGRSVLRTGLGANYMVTDNLGIRAKLGWETTSSLRVHGNAPAAQLSYSSKGFKNSNTLTVGAFVKF